MFYVPESIFDSLPGGTPGGEERRKEREREKQIKRKGVLPEWFSHRFGATYPPQNMCVHTNMYVHPPPRPTHIYIHA